MNPQTNEQTGLNLPPPIVEQGPIAYTPEAPTQTPETMLAPAEPRLQNGPAAATIPLPAMPVGAAPVQTPVVIPATPTATNIAADDGDLIEKEWVSKAKKIVEANREDPYQQSKQLTVVKVDYLQKRYNKTIKLAE